MGHSQELVEVKAMIPEIEQGALDLLTTAQELSKVKNPNLTLINRYLARAGAYFSGQV